MHARLLKRVEETPDFDIPEDISDGGYRWNAYVYSNLWRAKPSDLETADKVALISVWKTLQEFHTIFWQRNKLSPLDGNRLIAFEHFLYNTIHTTKTWLHFLIALHLLRNFRNRRHYVGDYEIENLPGLSDYI